MNERFAQGNTMPCITSVAPTISKLMEIPPPAVSGSDCLHEVIRAAGCQGIEKIARCLIYAPDAVGRQMRYFSELDDQDVTRRTIEVIKSDNFDFIVTYHSEYDDILHEMTPFCPEAIEALKHHLHAFSEFSKSMDVYWQKYNRMIWFAPDHGAHIDPQSGKGISTGTIFQKICRFSTTLGLNPEKMMS